MCRKTFFRSYRGSRRRSGSLDFQKNTRIVFIRKHLEKETLFRAVLHSTTMMTFLRDFLLSS